MTLLEVVLSMSLLVVLSSMTYWFYFTSISSRVRGTERASQLRLMRTVLRRISGEIRQAVVQSGDFGVGIIGGREDIQITTLQVPGRELARQRSTQEAPPEVEYDLVQVQYKIARHPDILTEGGWEQPLGLARVEKRIPRRFAAKTSDNQPLPDLAISNDGTSSDPFSRNSREFSKNSQNGARGRASLGPEINWEELYAPNIHYIRFCYYDGYSWWDDWHVTGENPLPQLIQVTLGFGDHPPLEDQLGQDETNEQFCACLNKKPSDCKPLSAGEYATTVRVTRADPLFRSRVSKESQSLAQELLKDAPAEQEGGGP